MKNEFPAEEVQEELILGKLKASDYIDYENELAGGEFQNIITKVLDNGTSLELYDTETQKFKQLKYLEFDDKNSIGETIRKVSIDKSTKTISLLVLDCISQNGGGSISQKTYFFGSD